MRRPVRRSRILYVIEKQRQVTSVERLGERDGPVGSVNRTNRKLDFRPAPLCRKQCVKVYQKL